MKILHIAETAKGGVGTVLHSLVHHQRSQSDVTKVSCLLPLEHSKDVELYGDVEYRFFNRKKRSINSLLHFALKTACILYSTKPDVVHLHSSFAGMIARPMAWLICGKKTKIIYSPHAFSFLMDTSALKKKCYIKIEKAMSFFCDKIICVSDYEYTSAVEASLAKDKLVMIYNGVDKKTKKNSRVLNDHGGVFKLLFVGRIDYQKGFDILIDVVNSINKDELRYKIELTVVGDSVNDVRDKYNVSNENLNIAYKGWLNQEKIEKHYLESDFVILPSRWEGFAMVPLESMSYGTPVIVSDIPPFIELISKKDSGIHFSLDDKKTLLEVLINLDKNDRQKLSSLGYSSFSEYFTSDKMNSETLILYKNTINSGV